MTRPAAEGTRRSFVVSSLAAAGVVMAGVVAVKVIETDTEAAGKPIHTDTKGLEAGEVRVPVADGVIPAYRAMPSSGGSYPVVLVVHESLGLIEHVKDLCRRLAKLGYVAIAPDLFARQSNAGAAGGRALLIATVADAEVISDLDATAAYAKALPQSDGGRLAITGFGWGGRIVWLYAAHNPALKAAVSWYGADRPPTPLRPKNPIDVIADLKCPVLALHGTADAIIPQAIVVKRQAACQAHHKECAYQFYPGVAHGFNIEGRQHYRADATADGWARLLAWFKQHGAAPSPPLAAVAGGSSG